jgi:hypothetical protein
MPNLIFNMTMNDGSRHFYAHPTVISWDDLLDHLEKLDGLEITGIVTDEVTETWADFTYRTCEFSINDQNGEFWFFSENQNCPEKVLLEIGGHCGQLPRE